MKLFENAVKKQAKRRFPTAEEYEVMKSELAFKAAASVARGNIRLQTGKIATNDSIRDMQLRFANKILTDQTNNQ